MWMIRWSIVAVVVMLMVGLPAGASAGDYFPQGVASGDPTPESVIVWTRVEDPARSDVDLTVTLEVATDPDFTDVVVTKELAAEARFDHCVKYWTYGLDPATTYYYRFAYDPGDGAVYSRTGRTKTAPSPDSDVPVRFAVVYGQDYVGHYFNTYAQLLADHPDDLDFIVHIGDYVYETTGDPSFQNPSDERKVEFEDTEGAIQMGDPANPYYAAASLSNYRTLYRTFRSDPVLQEVHAMYPMVVIWDDHEYSNDCWGDVATYFNGMKDEADPVRRRNAEEAFMEWIPAVAGLNSNGILDIGPDDLYPNSRIYRNIRYGANLNLLLTDYRTYRPDHLIPEDAFPGAIAVDEPTARQLLGDEVWDALRTKLDPYVDMRTLGLNILRETASLIAAQAYLQADPELDEATAISLGQEALRGKVSATYVNLLFQAAGLPVPFDETAMATMEHGVSYLYLGKTSLYSSMGSRYMVMYDPYQLLAGALFVASNGASENAFGTLQMGWLGGSLSISPAQWKILCSSVSMAPMILDFTNPAIAPMLPEGFPDALKTRVTVNVDQWEGFPNMREVVLSMLRSAGKTAVISGDIHASFVADHQGVYEFTPPAISSESLEGMVIDAVQSDPILGQLPGLDELLGQLAPLLQISAADDTHFPQADLAYAETKSNGFGVFDVDADSLRVIYRLIDASEAFNNYYDDPDTLAGLFSTVGFEVRDGMLSPIGE